MRGKGPAADLEVRRLLAVSRVDEGWAPTDVAAFLGVHPVPVAKRVARYRAGRAGGLKAEPTPVRPRFLTAARERKVLGWLVESPTKHGSPTGLGTARRVAERVLQMFGVRFHPNYLRAWLADRGYTPQKPARRARQRDPAAIDRWVAEDWPGIQKRPARRTPTSSGSTRPGCSSIRRSAGPGRFAGGRR